MSAPSALLSRTWHGAVNPRQSTLPPAFLLPSFFCIQSSSFSTSSPLSGRRDNNRNRGVSALRSTGPRKRQTLSVKVEDLPKPVPEVERSQIQVDPEHGLWQFFNRERTPFATPEYNNAHGRAWTVHELRNKDWEELHRLWWVCIKERNRLSTEERERQRVDAGYGEHETVTRDKEVRITMRGIKHVLTERWYAWEDARKIAARDPEVNLAPEAGEPAYNPRSFEVDEYSEDELLDREQSSRQSQVPPAQTGTRSEARL
ncbi:hypothetical protein AAFC00_004557 [Neodothiora populina]|uniref:Large ribosomal subunit protein uL29m n=1 Tax=Neodothiora populina TaxID=2781224 RepID=A0ABR3P2E2_9PEZI